MPSAGWIAWGVRREDDAKDQLRWARCGATMDRHVPGRIFDRPSVCALHLERLRPGLPAARNLRKRLRAIGDRHGGSGFVVVPFGAAELSARRSASIRVDADHAVGSGTSRVRCACAISGNRLAVESAGMERPRQVRFGRANLADRLRWLAGRSAWYCWPQRCAWCCAPSENRLPGPAQRHRLGDVRNLRPVHGLPVQRGGHGSLAGRPIGIENWISLAGLPILCVLFLQAMLLRRSLAHMGNGLVTRAWAALVYAIL